MSLKKIRKKAFSLLQAQQVDFTSGNLWKLVWILVLPAMLQGVMQTLYGMVDFAMVGRLGADVLAGVGLARTAMFIFMSMLFSSSSAVIALVSKYFGAKDMQSARAVAAQGISLFTFGGLLLWLIYYTGAGFFLNLLGATGLAHTAGASYLRWISASFLFIAVSVSLFSILRAIGDSITPLIHSTISNVLNIFLNYLLIYGNWGFPAMGVEGAALATIISRIYYCAVMFYFLGKSVLGIPFSHGLLLYLHGTYLKRILKLSYPSILQSFARESGRLLYVSFISVLGMGVIAALNIGLRIEAIVFMPGFAFSMAATTMVGQNLGAQDLARSRKSARVNCILAALFMSFLAIPMVIFANQLVRIFTDDPQVMAYARHYIYFVALSEPFLGIIFATIGSFRGAQKPHLALISDVIGYWGLRVPLCFLVIHIIKLDYWYVWAVISFATIVQALAILYIARRKDWLTLKVY